MSHIAERAVSVLSLTSHMLCFRFCILTDVFQRYAIQCTQNNTITRGISQVHV